MHTAKCQKRVLWRYGQVGGFYFAGGDVGPSHHAIVGAEHQVALGVAMLGKQSNVGSTADVGMNHIGEIQVGENIGIMCQKRFVALKEVTGFKDSAAGVEQEVAFVADGDVDAEIPILLEKIYYLVAEMMHIHHYVADAARYDIANYAFEHSHAGEFYERLGRVVGERTQSSAKSGCKYYCFHFFT